MSEGEPKKFHEIEIPVPWGHVSGKFKKLFGYEKLRMQFLANSTFIPLSPIVNKYHNNQYFVLSYKNNF